MKITGRKDTYTAALKATLCALFAVCCLVFSDPVRTGVKRGLEMCYTSLIPSLLPVMFCCTYLFSLVSRCGSRAVKTASCALLSLVGGFPMGAMGLCTLYRDGTLTKFRAERALAGAVNAGPAFLISGVGAAMFSSARAGVLLFVSLTAASVVCGALFLLYPCKESAEKGVSAPPPAPEQSGGFIAALDASVTSTVFLCGCVTFFCAVSDLMVHLLGSGPLSLAVSLLAEVSGGCKVAAQTGGLQGLFLACAAVSLCSVSIIMQVKRITDKAGLSLKYLYLSRPLHCAVSLAVLRLLTMSETAASVFSPLSSERELFSLNPEFSFFFLLTGVVFVLGKKRFARPMNRFY